MNEPLPRENSQTAALMRSRNAQAADALRLHQPVCRLNDRHFRRAGA